MAAVHRYQTLYSSSLLSITAFTCSGKCTPAGKYERSTQTVIALPRHGMFIKEVGNERHLGAPGHMLFFEPDRPYRVEHPYHVGDDCTILSFPLQTFDLVAQSHGFVLRTAEKTCFQSASELSPAQIHLLHGDLLREVSGAQRDSLHIEEVALEIIGRAVLLNRKTSLSTGSAQRASTVQANAAAVQATMVYLHTHMQRKVSLTDVARVAAVSPYHLCRIFRRHTGVTIHTYLTRIRLRSALYDLDGGAASLTQVALSYGFDSHAHFSSAFKRQFGVTPASYRSR